VKNLLKVFILISVLVLCFSAKSFASVDLSVWGGYSSIEYGSHFEDILGGHQLRLGIKGHYNIPLGQWFDLGLGVFFYYMNGTIAAPVGNVGGADIALFFIPPFMPRLCPYFRTTYALYNNIKSHHTNNTNDTIVRGNERGFGIEFAVSSSIRLFAEYMLSSREYMSSREYIYVLLKNKSSINVGLTYSMSNTYRSDRDGEQARFEKENRMRTREQKEQDKLEKEQRAKEQREREQRSAW